MIHHENVAEDLTAYDCTSLMIRLKLRLKKTGKGGAYEFKIFPEQLRTAMDLFSGQEYRAEFEETCDGKIHVEIVKLY
ncbi:MAG TPA: hypothetical protein VMS89_07480 [Methanoregulaceae archaeon]|nr:hypothetical protein [Methanoregulaceae archaeon]